MERDAFPVQGSDDTQEFWARLADYVAGDGSPEERAATREWFEASPDRRVALARAEKIWSADWLERPTDLEQAWDQFRSHAGSPQRASESRAIARPTDVGLLEIRGQSLFRRRGGLLAWPRSLWGLTAIVAVVLLSISHVLFRTEHLLGSTRSQTYRTASGQQATMRLVDGSRVTLAPATTVQVTPTTVVVRGEAYFDIVPHQDRPWYVTTTNAAVQVLGTKFSVRQYDTDHGSRVVVAEGKVALRSLGSRIASHAQTILTARMMGNVTDSSVTVTPDVAVSNYIGWMRGRLVFNEVRLDAVVLELARAYGADIRIADTTLARQPMTLKASIEIQPLVQILDFIGIATNAHYTRRGNAFVLVPGRAVTETPYVTPNPQPEKLYGR